MYNPKIIKIELKISLGIITLIPLNDKIEVIIIGPKNQPKGIFRYSANIAAGIEAIITRINSLDKICLKFSL